MYMSIPLYAGCVLHDHLVLTLACVINISIGAGKKENEVCSFTTPACGGGWGGGGLYIA